MRIFLDMDGVIANFNQGALDVLRATERYEVPDEWQCGVSSIQQMFSITDDEFWNLLPENFFETLEPMPDMKEILRVVEYYDPHFSICTSPGPRASAASQKIGWVRAHLDWRHRPRVVHDKWELAKPGRVLVDDWEKNTRPWVMHGGSSLLLPRPWNSLHPFSDRTIHYLEAHLSELSYQLEGIVNV